MQIVRVLNSRKYHLANIQAGRIDWEVSLREWAGFFSSTTASSADTTADGGRLLYLRPAYRLPDEAVVARSVKLRQRYLPQNQKRYARNRKCHPG